MKLISVVPTPNPNALKFTVGEELMAEGSSSFTSARAAESDPLAKALFSLTGVTSVFYMSNFITVNKNPAVSWDELESKILKVLREHEVSHIDGKKAEKQKARGLDQVEEVFEDMTPAQKILSIDRVLDEEIRPGLAGDGGGLEIVSLDGFILQVHYEGACGSCPSSTSGTLQYIQSILHSRLDERLEVIPV